MGLIKGSVRREFTPNMALRTSYNFYKPFIINDYHVKQGLWDRGVQSCSWRAIFAADFSFNPKWTHLNLSMFSGLHIFFLTLQDGGPPLA